MSTQIPLLSPEHAPTSNAQVSSPFDPPRPGGVYYLQRHVKRTMNTWEQQLSSRGHRITASRRAVMAALTEACEPLSAQELLGRAREHHHALGLVTVYRTLTLLSELELVRRVHRSDGCHGYLGASPGHHHAILCLHCGRAAEFQGRDDLANLLGRVQRETGFEIDDHLLQLYGTCAECREHGR